MRKLAEKVVLVAQICITLVFAITALLNNTNLIYPEQDGNGVNNAADYAVANNGVLTTLIWVLFIAYSGLSAYMLYVNFSERENLKRVLLFCDSESATHTTTKVVHRIIADCAKQTDGITVKKTRVRPDEKQGFAINLKVKVSADNVSQAIDTFRCMLADSFKNTLGLTFNSINFEVVKLNTHYSTSIRKAEEQAEKLGEQREIADEIYNEPLDNDINLDCVIEEKKNNDASDNL